MNDRELLELAAKAAGLDLQWCESWQCMAKWINCVDGFDRETCWRPNHDDGDALRLAVKLGLTLGVEYGRKHAHASGLMEKPIDGDVHAAMRRAIVRAAAEIGKQML